MQTQRHVAKLLEIRGQRPHFQLGNCKSTFSTQPGLSLFPQSFSSLLPCTLCLSTTARYNHCQSSIQRIWRHRLLKNPSWRSSRHCQKKRGKDCFTCTEPGSSKRFSSSAMKSPKCSITYCGRRLRPKVTTYFEAISEDSERSCFRLRIAAGSYNPQRS